jgi:hypothetical protein
MEKTIKKKKTPKKPKETEESLKKSINFFKKSVNENFAHPTKINFEKGEYIFLNKDRKKVSIDTKTMILAHMPQGRQRFVFATPILMLHQYVQTLNDGTEVYNEEEDEYQWIEEDVDYIMQDTYIFWKLHNYTSLPAYTTEMLSKKDYTALDIATTRKQPDIIDFNRRVLSSEPKILSNVLMNIENKSLKHKPKKEEKRIVWYDGKKYINDEISEIKSDKQIYTGFTLLNFTSQRGFVHRSKSIEASTRQKDSINNFDLGPHCIDEGDIRPVMLLEKGIIKFKDWVHNDEALNTSPSTMWNVNPVSCDIIIDFTKKEIKTYNISHYPRITRHSDCCGAHLPYSHPWGSFQSNEIKLNKDLASKIYLTLLSNNKADYTIFLTAAQKKNSLMYYEEVFGKDAVTLINEYVNMNSGNTIYVYYINVSLRIQKYFGLDKQENKSTWDFRNALNKEINKFASNKQTQKELTQWFENSEEIVKKPKPVISTMKEIHIRTRRNTTIDNSISSFTRRPLRNYSTR